MKKKWFWIFPTLAAVVIVGVVLAVFLGRQGHSNPKNLSTEKFQDYDHDSSLRWYETVEDVVLDGKPDDNIWKGLRPYSQTSSRDNRQAKYESIESMIQECKTDVYAGFGKDGLFIYAQTDDPVIYTGSFSPFSKTGFEFYIGSRTAYSRINNAFELTISADNIVRLRIRTNDQTTGFKEAWSSAAATGILSYTQLNEKGYSVECYIPWTTLNMNEAPDYLPLATAQIRVVSPENNTNYFWECFEYNSREINGANPTTLPLFDRGGYVKPEDGSNLVYPNVNIIDLSEDKGKDPKATTLNSATVTAFMKQPAAQDVFFKTKVRIQNVNPTDDPRVGVVLKGETKSDGSFDRAYLLIEMDEAYKGDGCKVLWGLALPSNNKSNDWKNVQWYMMDNHAKDNTFDLAIAKKNGKFYFYINNALVAVRDKIGNFTADTKVTCGIVSWYSGAVFSEYAVTTKNVDAEMAKMNSIFISDPIKSTIYFDLCDEGRGLVKTDESGSYAKHSIVNWNGVSASKFYAETNVEITGGYANPIQAGFVLTSGNKRLYVLFYSNGKGLTYAGCHSLEEGKFDDKASIWSPKFELNGKNKLAVYRDGDMLLVLVNDKAVLTVDLKAVKYPITGNTQVGLTGWKAKATFTDFRLIQGADMPSVKVTGGSINDWRNWTNWTVNGTYDKQSNTITMETGKSDLEKGDQYLPLQNEYTTDVYVQTTLKAEQVRADVHPRVGLRLINSKGDKLDYVFYYNTNKELQRWTYVVKNDDNNGKRLYYAFDSSMASISSDGIKLGLAKKGGELYFYVNDVLLGINTFEGFGAEDKVTACLYSKYTETEFDNFSATTKGIDEILAKKQNQFISDETREDCNFDTQKVSDNLITVDEGTHSYAKHSIINWNGVSASKFYAETNVEITGGYANPIQAGFVLTSGNKRLYVLFYSNGKGLTYAGCHSLEEGKFDDKASIWSPKFELNGKNKLAVYRDGDMLLVLVNDKAVLTVDLKAVKYPIAGNTQVGLTGWKAKATFTDFRLIQGADMPSVKVTGGSINDWRNWTNWSVNGTYSKQSNTITIETGKSDLEKGDQYLPLQNEYTTDVYVQTTLKAEQVRADVHPRVGLRLINSKGDKLDYVLYYNTNKELQRWVYVVKNDDNNGKRLYYAFDSSMASISSGGIKLGLAKKDGKLYFYVNDVLLGINTFEGFGAEDKVTACLYSKYTETEFDDFSATTKGIDEILAKKQNQFISDETREDCNFDTQKISDNLITVDEGTHSYAKHSIINWNTPAQNRFYAETEVELLGSCNGANVAQAGFVLTNGNHRLYILVYGTEKGITYVGYHSLEEGKFDDKKSEWSEKLTLAAKAKLAIYRDGNMLLVYVNDSLIKSLDMSKLKYPITGETQVGLTGWKAKANFIDMSLTAGEALPEAVLPNATEDELNHEFAIQTAPAVNVYAESTFAIGGVKADVSPRIGLRLKNEKGDWIDFVVYYNNSQALQREATIIRNDDTGEGKQIYFGLTSAMSKVQGEGVKFAVAKKDGNLYFYINDVLQCIRSFDGFGAEDKVTAVLYSKYSKTDFSNYRTVTDGLETMMNSKAKTFVMDPTTSLNSFDLSQSEAKTPKITIDDPYSRGKNTSIINWNGFLSSSFRVNTKLKITGGNNTDNKYGEAGLVVTDGNNRIVVTLYGDPNSVTYVDCYKVINNDYAHKEKIFENKRSPALPIENKLTLLRAENKLHIFVNDIFEYTVDLETYDMTGKMTVGMTSWWAKAEFSEYTLDEYDEGLIFNGDPNITWQFKPMNETPAADLYAETYLIFPETASSKVTSRVGLHLTNSAGEGVDWYVNYEGSAVQNDRMYYVRVDKDHLDNGSAKKYSASPGTIKADTPIHIAIEKSGDKIRFYVNGVQASETQIEGFEADEKVTAHLYSKETQSHFFAWNVR